MDVFHDTNAIGLIGVGIGIISIITAILIGNYQVRRTHIRKILEYHILSNSPIVAIDATVTDQVDIDIRVKGVSVKDAHLVLLLIKNGGKVSIHTTDYFEPLTFEFGTRVLSASVLETIPQALINPKDIATFLTLMPQSVQFPTFPFNPGDAIQINVLIEGKGDMKTRGRLDYGSIVPFEWDKEYEEQLIHRMRWFLLIALSLGYFTSIIIGVIGFSLTKDIRFLAFLLPTLLTPTILYLIPMRRMDYLRQIEALRQKTAQQKGRQQSP